MNTDKIVNVLAQLDEAGKSDFFIILKEVEESAKLSARAETIEELDRPTAFEKSKEKADKFVFDLRSKLPKVSVEFPKKKEAK